MRQIDGAYGEGGGEVLRTSLALSAITGQAVQITNIRKYRPKPGLQLHHLATMYALAAICRAELLGAELNSQTLTFVPRVAVQGCEYLFDIRDAQESHSPGALTPVLQALLVPLALASCDSHLILRGATCATFSIPLPCLEEVLLPMLTHFGLHARVQVNRHSWYPTSGGEIEVFITGHRAQSNKVQSLKLAERGGLRQVWGKVVVSNLPEQFAHAMVDTVASELGLAGIPVSFHVELAPYGATGAGLFLFTEYEHTIASFKAYWQTGWTPQDCARKACRDLLAFHRSSATIDMFLADQLVLPAMLADEASYWTTCRITQHLLTNCWLTSEWLGREVMVRGDLGHYGEIAVKPATTSKNE